MIKRILVPVDFSAPSLRAVDYALELSRRFKSQLTLLHVVEPVYYPAAGEIYGLGVDLGNIYDQVERVARARLARLAEKLRTRRAAVRTLLSLGRAHQVIAETAKKLRADLIVLSTHGRTGLSHVLMGSVAERVVRTAPCAVVTIRTRASGQPLRSRRTRRARPRRTATGGRSRWR